MTFEEDIDTAEKYLSAGGLILYPTDTIWGIGCNASDERAIKKIYQLKNRDEKKSMIILLANYDAIKNYVLHPQKKVVDFIKKQTRPTTAIFTNATNLPEALINEDGSIAIRIVKDNFCKALIEKINQPLVSTSANISGERYPKNFKEISEVIKNGVDYIVQHRRNDLNIYEPSSIIRLNGEGAVETIR